MTRDPLDDAAIEDLVREVAAGWTMPPVRLDAPSWRDRVRSPRTRRLAAARGWFGRFGQAVTAAIALTVVGGLVAVVVTRPPVNPGGSPGASAGTTEPGSTRAPAPSPLPKLVLDGDLPDPTTVLLDSESGDGVRVDLAKGAQETLPSGGRYGSRIVPLAGGGWLCLCLTESGYATAATRAVVTLDRYDAADRRTASQPIADVAGEPYPREPGDDTQAPGNAFTTLGFSADGRSGYVGWSVLDGPAWHSVLLVVSLADGSIAGRLDLPDATSGTADTARIVTAPQVIGRLGDRALLVARPWYEMTRVGSTIQVGTYRPGNDAFRATIASDVAGVPTVTALPAAGDCGAVLVIGGPLGDGGTWVACGTDAETTVVRRLDANGATIGDTRISGTFDPAGPHVVADPLGDAAFAWDPASATLTRVDLATGETSRSAGSTARLDRGPLAALGDWLAPSAAAKSLIRGALVVSPDGRRAYAIGSLTGGDEREPSGSTGIFVFDTDSMRQAGRYAPTADFVSIAVSADGRFLYAAGLPGVDAAGQRVPFQTSVTVFSTDDGSVRLIAGELGQGMLSFPSPVVR